MPTVTVTFVHATFLLATFVHIRNISAVTDPIFAKLSHNSIQFWFVLFVDVTILCVLVLAEHCTWPAMGLVTILQFNLDDNYLTEGTVVYSSGKDGHPVFIRQVFTWARGMETAN